MLFYLKRTCTNLFINKNIKNDNYLHDQILESNDVHTMRTFQYL